MLLCSFSTITTQLQLHFSPVAITCKAQPAFLLLLVVKQILTIYLILQLVRSNSRRFMPSQADEEAHQLSYLQKHMANVLTLLADSVDGEGDESMVSIN